MLVAPGASDAFSARLIEAHGYECGLRVRLHRQLRYRGEPLRHPRYGPLSLEELVAHAANIASAVRVPVIADAEHGFDPGETVHAFERAGVAAIHIEDHTGAGKHTDAPQELRPMKETAARIRTAVAASDRPSSPRCAGAL
jgi:methylisocitrate lyase